MTQSSKTEPSDSPEFNLKKVWQSLSPKLLSLVNISAILTVAGFFVIQSYLASFSSLSTFNISITQYLAAGINLVLGIVWYIILPITVVSGMIGLPLVVLLVMALILNTRSQRIRHLGDSILNRLLPLWRRVAPVLSVLWSIYQVFASIIFVLLVVALGLIYGQAYYARSPRMFGGGKPADVVLVFKEEQLTQNSIWAFPIDPSNPRQSETVQLLIELTDGIMVRHPSTNVAVIVKNDVLQGIIDAAPPPNNTPTAHGATPTQLPSATPTP